MTVSYDLLKLKLTYLVSNVSGDIGFLLVALKGELAQSPAVQP